jgi:hypothetical protein
MRFWRYDDFAHDYMLGQQFNYEVLILQKATDEDFKHIGRLDSTWLTSYAVVFNITKYEKDMRMYLQKHRDYRKLNDVLL